MFNYPAIGQFNPPTFVGNPIPSTDHIIGTSVAISPNIRFLGTELTVAVMKDFGPHNHRITVNDNNSLATLQSFVQPGVDPDVCYAPNPDIFFVATREYFPNWKGSISLDFYYLNTIGPPIAYNPPIRKTLPNTVNNTFLAEYPNIDMNAMWQGVIVYEYDGNIMANAFNDSDVYSEKLIAAGSQPDVAVHELDYAIPDNPGGQSVSTNQTAFTVTYVDNAGAVQALTYNYSDLLIPPPVPPAPPMPPLVPTTIHTLSNSANLSFPRIATPHNEILGSRDPTYLGYRPNFREFTIVTEQQVGVFSNIIGYFYDGIGGASVPDILLNGSITACAQNYRPVVTYHVNAFATEPDRVSVAWHSRHGGCMGAMMPEAMLQKDFRFDGTAIAPDYNRVNSIALANSFIQMWPSINSKYDGEGGTTIASVGDNYSESALYYSFNDGLWKNKNPVFLPQYKTTPTQQEEDVEFSVDHNSKQLHIVCDEIATKVVRVYNLTGQLLLEGQYGENESNMVINYKHLAETVLLFHYQSAQSNKTIKLINN